MWITLKISSRAWLAHGDKREIPAFDTVLFYSNLSGLQRKYSSDVPTDKIYSINFWAKNIKEALRRRYWWLKNKERKYHFRFVERRFLAAINCTGSAEGALAPVLLRITHWPKIKSGLPVSPPGLFPPWRGRPWAQVELTCAWDKSDDEIASLRLPLVVVIDEPLSQLFR